MRYLLFLLCLALPFPAAARPVSWPGGWMVMGMHEGDMSSASLTYSPSNWYSVGYKAEYWQDRHWQFHGVEGNILAKRWNNPASQANLFIKNAAGFAYSDYGAFDGKMEPAAMTGFEIDWENRRFFTLYENHLIYAGDIERSFMQKARVGIAPYIGDYGDLHTWLMLQVDHNPKDVDRFTVTPLVRLFKGYQLVEFGVSNQGEVLLNGTWQF